MKTWSILPFAVFGLLLVVLFASSCGDDDGSGGTLTPAPDGLSGEFSDDWFGGPYSFREGANVDKRDAFKCYKKTGLSLSEAVELDSGLLEQSLKANVAFPHGAKEQKYNYVIDRQGKIIVAQWNVEDLAQALGNATVKAQATADAEATAQAMGDAEANATNEEGGCEGKVCKGDADFIPQDPEKMVNWFPEDKDEDEDLVADPQSPCWLDRDDDGLLDAISKHLMLAQGVDDDGNGKTIGDFNVQKWATNDEGDWKKAKVAYAGEIIVDVVSCTYSLNNDSGTYQRDGKAPDPDKLAQVATHFANEIKVGPKAYFAVVFDENSGKKSPTAPLSTDNLFATTRKISDAPPLCS